MKDTKSDLPIMTAVVLFTIRKTLELLYLKNEHCELPTAYLNAGESLEACARRALYDTTGIGDVFLEQLYTFDANDESPRVIVAYYALVPVERVGGHHEQVGWTAPEETSDLTPTQQEIVRVAGERLAAKLSYAPIAYQFLAEPFTLSELQTVYEIIGREPLDKRNFRRRLQASSCLVETEGTRRSGRHRPAKLYRLRHSKPSFRGQEVLP